MAVKDILCVLTMELVVISGLSVYKDKCVINGKCLPCNPICKAEDSYNKQSSLFCERCPHGIKTTINQIEIECPEGEFKYKPPFQPFRCVTKCPDGTYKTVDHTCVDNCFSSGYPIKYKDTCYRKCPDDLYQDLFDCIKHCDDYDHSTIDKRCVGDCPKELPFLIENNNTCTDICPNNTQVIGKTCKGPYTYHIMVPVLVTIVVILVALFVSCTCYYMKTCPRRLKSEEDMVKHLLSANDEEIEQNERNNIVV